MKYRSEIYKVVHQDAEANFEVGAISKAQMQEFDQMCLVQEAEADEVDKPLITEPFTAQLTT